MLSGRKVWWHYAAVFVIIFLINFMLPRMMPGDPFIYLAVPDGTLSTTFAETQILQYREYYGLDLPLIEQFKNYTAELMRGNLGYSIYFGHRVSALILGRLPWTLTIAGIALLLSAVIGVLLGILSAANRHRKLDQILYSGMILLNEIPAFLLGILLLFFFAAKLKWFPLSGGATAFATGQSGWQKAVDLIRHGTLPVLALTLTRIGGFYLIARGSMVIVLSKDYIRTASAKGLPRRFVLIRHALRNAWAPILARIFISFGAMIGNTVLIETVFAYPGLGRLMREAVLNRDYILLQGIFLVMSVLVLILNWLSDHVCSRLDPRVVDK